MPHFPSLVQSIEAVCRYLLSIVQSCGLLRVSSLFVGLSPFSTSFQLEHSLHSPRFQSAVISTQMKSPLPKVRIEVTKLPLRRYFLFRGYQHRWSHLNISDWLYEVWYIGFPLWVLSGSLSFFRWLAQKATPRNSVVFLNTVVGVCWIFHPYYNCSSPLHQVVVSQVVSHPPKLSRNSSHEELFKWRYTHNTRTRTQHVDEWGCIK